MTSPALPLPATGPDEPTGPRAVLAGMNNAVDELNETLWAAQPGRDLVKTVEDIAVLRAKLDAAELAVTRELESNPTAVEALKDSGWASVKDYVTHATGGRRSAGSATVKLARQVGHHDALAEALADGALSRVKAQIITRAVDRLPNHAELREEAVQVLIEEAQRLSADDLERAGRHVLEVVDPDGVDAALERELERAERAAHLNRNLSICFDRLGGGDGRFNGSKGDLHEGGVHMFLRKVLGRAVAGTATTALLVAPLALTTAPQLMNVACTDDPNETTTSLSLSRTVAPYGSKTDAIATLSPAPASAGQVTFSVDHPNYSWAVSKRAAERVVRQLPRVLLADRTYTVQAKYDECNASATRTYEVVKADAKPRPAVVNAKRAKFRTTVSGEAGLDPAAGGAQFRVRKAAGGAWIRDTVAFLNDGTAAVNFKDLKRGRYILRVDYAGNRNFNKGATKLRFRVR